MSDGAKAVKGKTSSAARSFWLWLFFLAAFLTVPIASARPTFLAETRVGVSQILQPCSSPENPLQTLEMRWGDARPSCANALEGRDPINRIDPSGNDDISLSSVLISSSIGAGIGGAGSAVANYAMGRAVTVGSVLQEAAIGAVLGPGVLVNATRIGLGIGGVLVGGSYLPILTDPGASPGRKVAAAGLFVASIWGAQAGLTYTRTARVESTPESSTPEPTITLYHKGELNGGQVSGGRSLSLGMEKASVEALNRPGKVWTFKVPIRKLMEWREKDMLRDLRDYDAETGTLNNEVRVQPPASAEMNKYVDPN